jgi:hypothetical protein
MFGDWSVAQVVKYLSSKCKALSSMLNTAKKENIYTYACKYTTYMCIYIHLTETNYSWIKFILTIPSTDM